MTTADVAALFAWVRQLNSGNIVRACFSVAHNRKRRRREPRSTARGGARTTCDGVFFLSCQREPVRIDRQHAFISHSACANFNFTKIFTTTFHLSYIIFLFLSTTSFYVFISFISVQCCSLFYNLRFLTQQRKICGSWYHRNLRDTQWRNRINTILCYLKMYYS